MMKGCLHPIFFESAAEKCPEKCCPSEAAWGHVSSFKFKMLRHQELHIFFAQWQSIKRTWPKKSSSKIIPSNAICKTRSPHSVGKKTHLRKGDFSFRNPRPSDRKELSRRGRPSVRGVPAIVHKVLSTYAEWDVSVYINISTYIWLYTYTCVSIIFV